MQKARILSGFAAACERDVGKGGVYEILGTINSDTVKRGLLVTQTRRLRSLKDSVDRVSALLPTAHADVQAIVW